MSGKRIFLTLLLEAGRHADVVEPQGLERLEKRYGLGTHRGGGFCLIPSDRSATFDLAQAV